MTVASVSLAPVASADDAKPTAMVLVLDASGSMNEPDGHGSTKIKAAKAALKTIVGQLPADVQVGLRVYGHRVPSKPDHAKACQDTQLIAPVGPLDTAGISAAINRFRALGETPIGLSLQQAAADLPAGAQGSIVLVSDGQDSCAPPAPCDVAKQLKASGVNLTVDTVGLKVDAKAKAELSCIAQATGGTFTDVADAAQLAGKLGNVTQKAARPRRDLKGGNQITGGTTLGDAPSVTTGRYSDSIVLDETLYYAVTPQPGQKITARATIDASKISEGQSRVEARWTTADGSTSDSKGYGYVYAGKTLVTGATLENPEPGTPVYFTVTVEYFSSDPMPKGVEMPIALEVLGAGAPSATPEPAVTDPAASDAGASEATPAASSSDAAGTESSAAAQDPGYSLLSVAAVGAGGVAGGLLVGAIGGFVAGLRRGRRRAGSPPPAQYLGPTQETPQSFHPY